MRQRPEWFKSAHVGKVQCPTSQPLTISSIAVLLSRLFIMDSSFRHLAALSFLSSASSSSSSHATAWDRRTFLSDRRTFSGPGAPPPSIYFAWKVDRSSRERSRGLPLRHLLLQLRRQVLKVLLLMEEVEVGVLLHVGGSLRHGCGRRRNCRPGFCGPPPLRRGCTLDSSPCQCTSGYRGNAALDSGGQSDRLMDSLNSGQLPV